MGCSHSSLNCERISVSIQKCLGLGLPSNKTYQATADKQADDSDSAFGSSSSLNGGTEQIFTSAEPPKRKLSRRSRCSKDCYCCKNSDEDSDGFSYNICDQSMESQLNPIVKNVVSSNTSSSPRPNSRRSSVCTSERKSSNSLSSTVKLVTEIGVSQSSIRRNSAECQAKRTTVVSDARGMSVKTIVNGSDNEKEKASAGTNFNHVKVIRENDCSVRLLAADINGFLPEISAPSSVTENKRKSMKSCEDNTTPPDNGLRNCKNSDISYFRNLVLTETNRLNQCIESWNDVLMTSNKQCPTEVYDEIRTVIGQTTLVVAERFTQFSKLVDRADGISSTDDRPVLLSDLQGFWDMIYFQVEDVNTKFDKLMKLKSNHWKTTDVFVTEALKTDTLTPKKTNELNSAKKNLVKKKKKTQASEEERKRREAARKRLAEARKALAQRNQVEQDSNAVVAEQAHSQEAAERVSINTVFITDTTTTVIQNKNDDHNDAGNNNADDKSLRRRPESIVDAIACSVAVNHVSADTPMSSLSSTSLVH